MDTTFKEEETHENLAVFSDPISFTGGDFRKFALLDVFSGP